MNATCAAPICSSRQRSQHVERSHASSYKRDNICQRGKQDRQPAFEMHALDTLSKNQLISSVSMDEVQSAHNLGDHAAVKLNVTLALPDDVHVKLDTTRGSLVNINCTHSERHVAEIELSESKVLQWTRQCGGKNRLDDLLCHVGASDADVGP